MRKRKPPKKYGYLKCGINPKHRIRYKVRPKYVWVDGYDPNRLIAIRKHWSKYHPRAWSQAIQRGVVKRRKRRK